MTYNLTLNRSKSKEIVLIIHRVELSWVVRVDRLKVGLRYNQQFYRTKPQNLPVETYLSTPYPF